MLVTALTVGLVGVSYGATAVAAGFPIWFPVTLAVTVVAASSEFVLIGVLATGGGALAAATAGLLLNLRHLPYGLTVHDAVGSGWRRLIGSHLLNDETVAFTVAEIQPATRRAALTVSGLAILVCWPGGALLGAAAGRLLADPDALGLDAVFPAVIATLVLPKLTGRLRIAALTGAAFALGASAVLPAGLPILSALLGLVTLVRPQSSRRRPS
jgi:predicted branched-subunit amino acid permease